jgi:molybdopterin-containing oxidoreductase family iron-sulfur binding subunit
MSDEPGLRDDRSGASDTQCSRRGFLRWAGFSAGASVVGACSPGPVEKAIPYLVQAEEIIPGEAVHYTSVCSACPAGCGIIGKCVDGRPVKLEGNPEHPVSRGALCPIGQAAILELYDSARLTSPLLVKKPAGWPEVDHHARTLLNQVRESGKRVYFLTRTINSPTLRFQIESFLRTFPSAAWISYDPVSSSTIAAAHELTHGIRLCPDYRLDRAEVIASIEADFLGTWISPVGFAQGYRDGRSLEGSRLRFSHHIHFESLLSLTGAKADIRYTVPPGAADRVAASLARAVGRRLGLPVRLPAGGLHEIDEAAFDSAAERLASFRGKSLVLCGAQSLAAQILVNFINDALDNYGRTLDIQYPSFQRLGWEADLTRFLEDLEGGKVGAVLTANANPVYELPFGQRLSSLLEQVPLTVSFTSYHDETSEIADVICPTPHFLESWGDSQPSSRVLAIQQPLVNRAGDTRGSAKTLSAWANAPGGELELVRNYWEEQIFPRRVGFSSFDEFWNESLVTGVAKVRPERMEATSFDMTPVEALEDRPNAVAVPMLVLRPSLTLGDGRHALNPWLQELPDPLTRLSWGNALQQPGIRGDSGIVGRAPVARISGNSVPQLDLPVLYQAGLHHLAYGASLGHGRKGTEELRKLSPQWIGAPAGSREERVGCNLFPWVAFNGGFFRYEIPVSVSRTGRTASVALVQRSGTDPEDVEVVALASHAIRELSLERLLATRPIEAGQDEPNLWPEDHSYPGHHWGMVIDLGACTGCGACVIACQAENNIPVVGEDEVARDRAMHWIRVDQYARAHQESMEIWFQPMLCQHCDRAPCETVCPVLATVHSAEGLNEQVYNRCVGTRYCANNCPYKVRAFNWFDYSHGNRRENLQLNPDVTVRSRGVMEKCTFCTQRIQVAKILARSAGEAPRVATACQQSCPSRAIIFGDMNNPAGELAALLKSPRSYQVLKELGTRPSISYLGGVRNRPDSEEPDHG